MTQQMLHVATALTPLTCFFTTERDARLSPAEAVGIFRKFRRDDRAAISVLAALSLAAVIGISALALEFGHALLRRSDNQRIAELAAYGGALVYNSVYSSTKSTIYAMRDGTNTAKNIVALNGLPDVSNVRVTSAIVPSPRADGNQAMQVTVNTDLPMYLARVLTGSATLAVAATAYAEIRPGAPSTVALVQ